MRNIACGTLRNRLEFNEVESVFNDDSVDVDFRVESNSNANRFFIDGGSNSGEGAVIVGHNASLGQHRVFQIAGTTSDTGGMEMFKYSNDATGPTISLSKSRGGAIGTATTVNDNDNVGTINWFADDGTDVGNYVATIHAEIDGTPGSNDTPGALVFSTTADGSNSATESARIDNVGDFHIGDSGTLSGNMLSILVDNSRTGNGILLKPASDATINAMVFKNSSNANAGFIQYNASSTSYATSSDYRLKENVDYTWDATTRLKQLKPARFNFISDETNTLIDGFLAHEVSSIVPQAVSGEKDAVDSEGNPEYQGIDQSKLVPLLVKTIQELEARITTLEG